MNFGWWLDGLGWRARRLQPVRIAQAIQWVQFSGVFYGNTLRGRAPERLNFALADLWPGDAARGAAIVKGEVAVFGQTVAADPSTWVEKSIGAAALAELHGFTWLADLKAVSGEAARETARSLIDRWTQTQMRWQPTSWRADVVATRLSSWIAHAEFFGAQPDTAFAGRFLDSVGKQIRHLRRLARSGGVGIERFVVLKGLILGSLCVAGERYHLERWVKLLERDLDRQVLPDGGVIERSPMAQLGALRAFIEIRAALREADASVPEALQHAIDRAAPMLRFFRHGDGGLALFNGANEGEGWQIDVVLARAEARGKPLVEAPHSGFQRLAANRTLVLVDTGAPPSPNLDRYAHAGTLSFEMSVGRERLIVNCGAQPGAGAEWERAQRATAAHSTLAIEDLNSAELLAGGGLANRPRVVVVERKEADGALWLEASHDGYETLLGIEHHRRLYLSADGGDLRGEDSLTGAGTHKFVVRFHLHPTVQASLVHGGQSVLLKLPGGIGFRLRAAGGALSLQESVYLGRKGEIRRTEQVVISGATQNGEAQIKWAITRV